MLRNIILRIHLSRLTKRPPVGGFVIVLDLVQRNNRGGAVVAMQRRTEMPVSEELGGLCLFGWSGGT